VKDMPSYKFWDFVLRRMLVTYLTLIPSFLLTIISLSFLSAGILAIHITLVLIGTFVMFKQHALEKSIEITKKVGVFVEDLKNKIADPTYVYSLPLIALEVARSEKILKKTQAWDQLLSKLSEELTNEICTLHERIIKSSGKDFSSLFKDFCHTLTLLKKLKKGFYKMVDEIGKINFAMDFGQDMQFRDRFKRLSEEYNGYMGRLMTFSDNLKAETGMKLDENLLEHICSASELFMTIHD